MCDGQLSRAPEQKDLNGDTCPICHGEEWVYEHDEHGVEYATPCKCREQKVMDRRLQFAELPDSLKEIRLNTFNLRRYTRDESREIAAVACKGVKFYLDNLDAMIEKGMGLKRGPVKRVWLLVLQMHLCMSMAYRSSLPHP